MPNTLDRSLLEAAVLGYEAQLQKIQDQIAQIQRQLNGRTGRANSSLPAASTTRTKRRMSASARRRIAAAQKRRWAEYRKKQKAA